MQTSHVQIPAQCFTQTIIHFWANSHKNFYKLEKRTSTYNQRDIIIWYPRPRESSQCAYENHIMYCTLVNSTSVQLTRNKITNHWNVKQKYSPNYFTSYKHPEQNIDKYSILHSVLLTFIALASRSISLDKFINDKFKANKIW